MERLSVGRLVWRAFQSGLVSEVRVTRDAPYLVLGEFSQRWYPVLTEQDWIDVRLREQEEAKRLKHRIRQLAKQLRWTPR